IYPINFDRDPDGIRAEVLRIIELWISRGIRIFRVDNPHTKPLDFWEWLLGEVADRHPDVVFLAEAFTRPAMLHSLAGAGFHQSYTYFTWRNTKDELEEFLTGIAGASADYLRPNLFEHPRHPHRVRSEEHTSELQSRENLVCRLLLEKKKKHIEI